MNKQGYISKVRNELKSEVKHNKTSIEKLASSFGITNKNLVKEYTELAIVLNAREAAHNHKLSTYNKYQEIVDLYNSQVNLSMRTSMSMLMQQYSTAAPISFLASSYVLSENINAQYFEPSAGNGLLTIALPYEQTIVNELDDVRLENLKEQPFKKVHNFDALQIPHTYDRKFDGVITNPPFGSLSEPMFFGKFKIKGLEHAMSLKALQTMKDNGKCAIIIGGHTSWDEQGRVKSGKNRIFLNYLYHFYNVEDIIPINGSKLYSRQGTSFDTRLILINGAKEKPEGASPLKSKLQSTVVNTHEELWERVGLENSLKLKTENSKSDESRKFTKGLKVYYGYRKLTVKAVRKPQLVIFFENVNHNAVKNEDWVKRRMKIVHVRKQNDTESSDSNNSNRTFTEYGYFINEKPYNGDIEKLLEDNYQADKNHVSQAEREIIRGKLRDEYYRFYDVKKPRKHDNNLLMLELEAEAIIIIQLQG